MADKAATKTLDFRELFTPKQWAATIAADQYQYTLFGGSRGPGKSYWLRWYALRFLLMCHRHGIDGVTVGLFCEDYPILVDRQISKIEAEFPKDLGTVRSSQTSGLGFHLVDDAGGGVIALRNLDDPSKYQSAEFALIAVDELTKNPVSTFNILRGSMRWPGIQATRFVATTNPGGIGHLWVKSYWLDGIFPPELQKYSDRFKFVRALPDDNPHLDSGYWETLGTLPNELARAWRYGDWDVFSGQVFTQWSLDRHVVKPFEVPAHWRRWRGVDWGHSVPFCCLWIAQDPDTGRVYVYRELYKAGWSDREQARQIKALTSKSETIPRTWADPSMWTVKTMEDKTFSTADEYAAEGVALSRADNTRILGKRKIDTLLEAMPDGKPGLQIFSTCADLIRTLPALPHDRVNVEDVDSKAEDHAYDALRYALTDVNARPTLKPQIDTLLNDPMLRRAQLSRGGLNSSSL